MNEYANKVIKKKRPTKFDVQLHKSTNRAISAYMALVNQNKLGVEEDGTEVTDLKQYKKTLRKKPKTNQSDEGESNSESDSD